MIFAAGFLAGAACAGAAAFYIVRRRTRLLGSLLSFAAHEVNTPVTAINMTVLNFLSGIFGPIADDQLKWMEMMSTQTGRLNGIMGELRDMIHYELKGDLAVRVEPVSVQESVDSVMQSLKSGLPTAEFHIELVLAKDLPQVLADPDRLTRSLSSLLFHARKFRSSGGIVIEAGLSGKQVALSVEYLGSKIAPSEIARSLELYYPAYKRKDQLLSAVGMGLGALKIIMRLQGGDLQFKVDEQGKSKLTMLLAAA